MVVVLMASAIIPRGYMVAPSPSHGIEVTACPETNPLARIAVHRQSEEHHKAHAAMGHDREPSESAPSTGQSGGDCAFAGAVAQGLASDIEVWDAQIAANEAPLRSPVRHQIETRPLRLRPPLRGPPQSV
jgi:hypothetical protein